MRWFRSTSSDPATTGTDDERAAIAHLLRRLTFGPFPGQIDELVSAGREAALDRVVHAPPVSIELPELGTDDDYALLVRWWLEVMRRPDAGLHEKLVWFWHGHLTSSLDKSVPKLMLRQHVMMREHALGNVRELLQRMAVDGAMLEWLDGAWSTSAAPNENFARELMELFALGRGSYDERDVRAGAYALSGWWIDYDNDHEVRFEPDNGPQHSVQFLGRTVATASDAIAAVCDHPSFSRWIAGRLHRFLVGVDPDASRLEELATVFHDGGLEVLPLVEAIVRHPSFMELRMNRPRTPVEWLIATRSFLETDLDHWILYELGQVPFAPPNVAGWAWGDRWLSAGASFAKAHVAWDNCWDTAVADTDDPVGWIIAKAGLHEVTGETRAVLENAAARVEGRRERATVLHALVVCSPEFSIA
jgi:uncharacterized protein (DUF1800 family)